MAKNTFGLHFGALAKPIADQLHEQGLKYDVDRLEQFQKDADAITRLAIRNYLPDSVKRNIHKKLLRFITAVIQ